MEGEWVAWPFQRAILACVGNDEVRAVDVKKSARVGYTKILLAGICYFAGTNGATRRCSGQPTTTVTSL